MKDNAKVKFNDALNFIRLVSGCQSTPRVQNELFSSSRNQPFGEFQSKSAQPTHDYVAMIVAEVKARRDGLD